MAKEWEMGMAEPMGMAGMKEDRMEKMPKRAKRKSSPAARLKSKRAQKPARRR
jgi:hypothetical protein